MAVIYAIFWGEDIAEIVESLPEKAQAALAGRLDVLERRPHAAGNPARYGGRSATFGEGGEGLLEYWVDDDRREIWITAVAWIS